MPPLAPERADARIPAIPAFAGTGKHRDDNLVLVLALPPQSECYGAQSGDAHQTEIMRCDTAIATACVVLAQLSFSRALLR